MKLEIRPADGGADAEMFASEIRTAMKRALQRDGISFKADDDLIVVTGKIPSWL